MAKIRDSVKFSNVIAWLVLVVLVPVIYTATNLPLVQSLEKSLQSLSRWKTTDVETLDGKGGAVQVSGRDKVEFGVSVGSRVDQNWMSANIVGRKSDFRRMILLDKGKNDGVKLGMTIAQSGYFLGQIWNVESDQSTALILGDPELAVAGVLDTRGQQDGLVELSNGGLVFSHVLGGGEDLARKVILTSGEGFVAPAGLVIGQVTGKISQDSFGQDIWGVDYPDIENLSVVRVSVSK